MRAVLDLGFLAGLGVGALLAALFGVRAGLVVGGGAMLCAAGLSPVAARAGGWARRRRDVQDWYDSDAIAACWLKYSGERSRKDSSGSLCIGK